MEWSGCEVEGNWYFWEVEGMTKMQSSPNCYDKLLRTEFFCKIEGKMKMPASPNCNDKLRRTEYIFVFVSIPFKQSTTMNRILQTLILLTLTSCGQNSSDNKTIQSKDPSSIKNDHLKQDTNSLFTFTKKKHQTFNEPVETLPSVLKAFVPNEYAVINVSTGDANLDGLADKILVLRKNTEETTSNYAENKPDKRPLLLLLGQADKTYTLAFRNDNAVLCIDCGGVFGDPFTGTTIKKGYFSIEHGISGGKHWESVTTFKFDKAKGNWFLYKDHFISYKLNESNDENAEALVKEIDTLETIENFGIVPFDKYNTYSDKGY